MLKKYVSSASKKSDTKTVSTRVNTITSVGSNSGYKN